MCVDSGYSDMNVVIFFYDLMIVKVIIIGCMCLNVIELVKLYFMEVVVEGIKMNIFLFK